ncbi:hypothetical protein Hdeb2414_s0027g00687031 [Helianthus debilis subsp. tardiflorus]
METRFRLWKPGVLVHTYYVSLVIHLEQMFTLHKLQCCNPFESPLELSLYVFKERSTTLPNFSSFLLRSKSTDCFLLFSLSIYRLE